VHWPPEASEKKIKKSGQESARRPSVGRVRLKKVRGDRHKRPQKKPYTKKGVQSGMSVFIRVQAKRGRPERLDPNCVKLALFFRLKERLRRRR